MTNIHHIYHVEYTSHADPRRTHAEFVCARSLREAADLLLSEIRAEQDGEVVVDKIMDPQVFRAPRVIDSGLLWCDAFKLRNGKLYRSDGFAEDNDDLEGDPRYDGRRFD